MRCSNCGNELIEGTKVCPRCGARQNTANNKGDAGSGASKKSLGVVFGLVAVIVVVLVVGVIGVAKVTNTDLKSFISGDVKKYNDEYYGNKNSNSSYGGNTSSYNGGGNNNNGGGNQYVEYNENDYERYEYDPKTRIVGSKNKKTNKILTYYDTPIENISVEENEVIYANNELMITAKSGTDLETVKKTVAKYGGEVVGINDYVNMYQVQFNKNYTYDELNDLSKMIMQEGIIKSVSANVGIIMGNAGSSISNDKELQKPKEFSEKYSIDWWYKEIQAEEMYKLLDKQEMKICGVGIIDSGIYEDHADLKKFLYKEKQNAVKDEEYKETKVYYPIKGNSVQDNVGKSHGTHVSGIIGAERNNNEGIAGMGVKVSMYAIPSSSFTNRVTIRELLPGLIDEDLEVGTQLIQEYDYENNDGKIVTKSDDVLNYVNNRQRETYNIGMFAFQVYQLTKCIAERNSRVVNISQYWAIADEGLFSKVKTEFENILTEFVNTGYDFCIVKSAGNSREDCTYCYYSEELDRNYLRTPPNRYEGEDDVNYSKRLSAYYSANKRYQILENITIESLKNRIIVVGAEDVGAIPSEFSNYGERVDIYAPGTHIYSCIYNSSDKGRPGNYWYMSGTSMAAPVVTGVIANMFSVNPNLKSDEIKEIIKKTATKDLIDNGGYKHKIINGYESVKYVMNLEDNEGTMYVGAVGSYIANLGGSGDDYKVVDKDETTGLALLVAEKGVDCVPYVKEEENGTNMDWNNSDIKKYLEEEYIKNFEDRVKEAMSDIRILSKEELEKYYGADVVRQLKASDKAVKNGAYVCEEDDKEKNFVKGNTIYWVKDAVNKTHAMVVNSSGVINDGEGAPKSRRDVCVRPAMWVRYKEVKRSSLVENILNVFN